MPNLNLTQYRKNVESGDVISSFKTLKSLYGMVDNSLSQIASQFDDSSDSTALETQLLNDKETLVNFASKTKCRTVQEISQKVDFLNLVHLNELSADELTETEILTRSVWQDCQFFL